MANTMLVHAEHILHESMLLNICLHRLHESMLFNICLHRLPLSFMAQMLVIQQAQATAAGVGAHTASRVNSLEHA